MKRALRQMKNEADFVYEAHLRCMIFLRHALLHIEREFNASYLLLQMLHASVSECFI